MKQADVLGIIKRRQGVKSASLTLALLHAAITRAMQEQGEGPAPVQQDPGLSFSAADPGAQSIMDASRDEILQALGITPGQSAGPQAPGPEAQQTQADPEIGTL